MHNQPIFPRKLPKIIRRFWRKITEVEDDRNNQNGWWVHLSAGWINQVSETHIIHEDTLMECLEQLRNDVVPCKCDECRKDQAVREEVLTSHA